MKLYFKPMPWLTAIVAICLAILISLGTWQYQRLQWKTALLAEVDAAAEAAPFTSLADVQAAIDAGDPVDFRRYGSSSQAIGLSESFLVFTAVNKDISWRVFTAVENSDINIFAGLGVVSNTAKEDLEGFADSQNVPLIGYVRLAREATRGAAKSSPEKNRWFGFNPLPDTHDWSKASGIEADMRFYIDTVPGASDADLLPPKRPDIRNNHLDYMLTWYSFAVILLIIYFILHRRAGRLKFS